MQFSLFGASAAQPQLVDLDGLLLAGGSWVRGEQGAVARLSVLVADLWRAAALRVEFAERGLDAEVADTAGSLLAVRTDLHAALALHAARWTRGASLRPPADLQLTASGLRLWAIAVGRSDEAGYLLMVSELDADLHRIAGAQLARLGVAAVSVGARGGPGWRITSIKRLRRFAELVGEAPAGAGRDWPLLR